MTEDKEYYTIHCYKCYTTTDLTMLAQRISAKMVGWIYSCVDHIPAGEMRIIIEEEAKP